MFLLNLLVAASGTVAGYQERPNIIVFLVDDMGLMDTSVPFLTDGSGNRVRHSLNNWYHTPNMERMAEQGICFSTFYAQSVSSPSRASLLTGQNATRHRTTNWINAESNNRTPFGPPDWNWKGLTKDIPTMPKVLQQAGYKTIHIGKAHFGCMDSEGENPLNLGFDVNIAGSGIGHPGSYYGEWGYGHIKGSKARAVPDLEKYHGTDTFLSEALTIEANREIAKAVEEKRPFFLYYGLHQPHVPRVPNERFIGKSGMGPRGDVILEADWCVDEFLKELDRLGLAENTIVILTSDNGPVLDDGYKDQAVELVGKHRPAGPLRGWKTTMYDGGVRVPFMLRWPAMVKPGVSDAFVCQMDLLASFAGLLGQTYPDKLDSRNTLKAFLGKSKKGREELVIEGMFNYAYRKGDWALIPPYRKQTEYQLYNLKEDIGQKHNLADKYPKKVKELTDEFEALKLSTGKKTRF